MKKKYIQPEVQTYQVNTSKVICASGAASCSMSYGSTEDGIATDANGDIVCGAASYRSALWE